MMPLPPAQPAGLLPPARPKLCTEFSRTIPRRPGQDPASPELPTMRLPIVTVCAVGNIERRPAQAREVALRLSCLPLISGRSELKRYATLWRADIPGCLRTANSRVSITFQFGD